MIVIKKFATGSFRYGIKKFTTSTRKNSISYAEQTNSGKSLKVEFTGNQTCEYPTIFLQDNCTCPKCFHPSSRSRLRKMTELKLDNVINKVAYTHDEVKCIWGDGHESVFLEKWLYDRRFTKDNIQTRKLGMRDNPILVNSRHSFNPEKFENILNDGSKLLKVLETLCKTGAVLIEEAPKKVSQLRKLAEKIGFIRITHYGHEFTVKSEMDAVNLAYTSNTLCVHTDLPYYVYPPGVQLLHCIKQYAGEDGGRSHLVDGFFVAKQMRERHSKEFKTLYQVPLEFYDVGKDYIDFHKIHHSPTFVMSPGTTELTRIVYSNQQLSSHQPIPLEKVDDVYKALKLFTDLCYEKDNLLEFKLKEGDILLFDNWRFLHGREGFNPQNGNRHLEGCYIDWDEIFSRINVLKDSS